MISKMKKNPIYIFGGVLIAVLILAFIVTRFLPRGELVLQDADTKEVYQRYILPRDGTFSVTFIDSASRTPYTDYYELTSEGLFVVGVRYYNFGNGVPVRLEEGQRVEYLEDGSMKIVGMRRPIQQLTYTIGTSADHVLRIGEEKYGLSHICGAGKIVNFDVK